MREINTVLKKYKYLKKKYNRLKIKYGEVRKKIIWVNTANNLNSAVQLTICISKGTV